MVIRSRKAGLLRTTVLLLALVGAVLLVACTGPAGRIYGQFDYDGYIYAAILGGFPSGIIYANHDYEITAGTYSVKFTLSDGTYYYPGYFAGYPTDPSWYYNSTYTCSANAGKPFWAAGDDKYFRLYLGYTGLQKSGSFSVKGTSPKVGTSSWTENGLLVTVTTKIGQTTPDRSDETQGNQILSKSE